MRVLAREVPPGGVRRGDPDPDPNPNPNPNPSPPAVASPNSIVTPGAPAGGVRRGELEP